MYNAYYIAHKAEGIIYCLLRIYERKRFDCFGFSSYLVNWADKFTKLAF